ncbi:MAG: cytochrome C, partial [Marinilabiliales bacterium]
EYLKKEWPVLDLNIAKNRNALIIFGIGSLFFLFLTAMGSYEAFHYTESVEFCGTLCHEVMEPEYVAYQNSPHSKVVCVACHVGSGADWYVKSKLSGVRQVIAVITDDFDRPIETPVRNLRPARETCEECHWPQKFYERQLRYSKHFLTDEENTEWNISMQMKIGPTHSAQGLSEGIHWHINPDVKIEYISKEHDREQISWVKYTDLKTGKVTIYEDETQPFNDEKIESSEPRVMDCMDCHNRPSHNYLTPQEFVDHSMASGDIPSDLPFIKSVAMSVFTETYPTKDTMLMEIENYVRDYYDRKFDDKELYKDKIEKAISGLKKDASSYIFPEMKASWDVYPNHIGHKTFNGCFRCHTDNHKSESGESISKDCNICHNIIKQGVSGEEEVAFVDEALEFKHPVDIDGMWKDGLCYECHRNLY